MLDFDRGKDFFNKPTSSERRSVSSLMSDSKVNFLLVFAVDLCKKFDTLVQCIFHTWNISKVKERISKYHSFGPTGVGLSVDCRGCGGRRTCV
jgi:hypothetical protein